MLSRLLKSLWSARNEFLRYFAIGISAFVFDIGSLYGLKEYADIPPVTAVILNQLVILTFIFFLNKHWSFKAKGVTHQQIIRFVVLSIANYIFAIAWMWTLHQKWEVNYLMARIANIVLAVGWNFLLYRYWVYRVKTPNSQITNSKEITNI